MGHRAFTFLVSLCVLIAAQPLSAQTTPTQWAPPVTSDGQPDLEGNWVNRSATPLERPAQLKGRQSLTDAEVNDLRQRADRIFRGGRSDFPGGDDFFLAALANVEQYKSATATGNSDAFAALEFDNRTSLIINPPDGRLPPYTPEGERRRNALTAAVVQRTRPNGPEDLAAFQRCITWGVPMPRPGNYTSYYQIVQSPGYVVIVTEVIHDARVIPLRSEHLPPGIRAWNGDSVGHWEGNTLIVDTTNFSQKNNFMGSAEGLHLIERFTRIAPDEIRYEITVQDPATWITPWTASLRLKQTQDKMYEFACHEGNSIVVEGMLAPASR
jgi:hypothetical protein